MESLLNLVDEGRIDEAENRVYEMADDLNKSKLEIALLFYSYLNDKSDDFLKDNHFSRNEVMQGLKDITSRYGLDGIGEIILQ